MNERQKVTALSSRSSGPAPVAVWKLVGIAMLIFLVLVSGISITLNRLQRKPVLGVVQAQAPETTALVVPATIRSFPDTTETKTYYEALPSGGGIVPADGAPPAAKLGGGAACGGAGALNRRSGWGKYPSHPVHRY